MARMTVHVSNVVANVNDILANPNTDLETRKTFSVFVESLLMTADRYRGFGYLAERDLPPTVVPGIRRNVDENRKFENTDEFRRVYHV